MSETEDNGNKRNKGLFGLFQRKGREQGLRHSIAALVEEAATPNPEAGSRPELDRQERALITNVLHLRETTADDVMVPRADIVAMSADLTLDEALDFMRRENHSRVPVYRDQLDNLVGMIHVKDLIAYAGTSKAFNIETLLRQPLMVAPQIPHRPAVADAATTHPSCIGDRRVWRDRRPRHHRGSGGDHRRRYLGRA